MCDFVSVVVVPLCVCVFVCMQCMCCVALSLASVFGFFLYNRFIFILSGCMYMYRVHIYIIVIHVSFYLLFSFLSLIFPLLIHSLHVTPQLVWLVTRSSIGGQLTPPTSSAMSVARVQTQP